MNKQQKQTTKWKNNENIKLHNISKMAPAPFDNSGFLETNHPRWA
jgi:hypothetical protein